MPVQILDREMYSVAEAARLLRMAPSTLHYWLEGGERRGKTYRPIIRVEPQGRRTVTWAEFVEAAMLRQYRRKHRVPMVELRAFIDTLRGELGIPYPLADQRPYIGAGRALMREAQEDARLDADFCLVAVARDQLVLTPASQAFVDRVAWHNDIATAWRPHDEAGSPVLIDPDLRFGRPSIRGISTRALWEQEASGETVDEVGEVYGLSPSDVRWALAYENSARAA